MNSHDTSFFWGAFLGALVVGIIALAVVKECWL
jgi:hypothetical protein